MAKKITSSKQKPRQPDQPLLDTRPFEEILGELEQIVGQLEAGRLGLSEALACYEKGVRCLKEGYATLESAEQRIEQLVEIDDDGLARTAPAELRRKAGPSEENETN